MDDIFLLVMNSNFSFTELINLPVGLRNYYIRKFIDYKEKEAEAYASSSKK